MQQPRTGLPWQLMEPPYSRNNNNTLASIKTQCFQRVANITETSQPQVTDVKPITVTIKLKVIPVRNQKTMTKCEGMEVNFHAFLTSLLDGWLLIYLKTRRQLRCRMV
jgi:hypothetical protein